MIRKLGYAVASVLLAVACASAAFAAKQREPIFHSPRIVLLLDKGWMFHRMPDFQLWPPQARLIAEQIAQLH